MGIKFITKPEKKKLVPLDITAALSGVKGKKRDLIQPLLQRYGVRRTIDLLPEQYEDFLRDVEQVKAGKYNPEESEGKEL